MSIALVLLPVLIAIAVLGMAGGGGVPQPEFKVRRVGGATYHAGHGRMVGMMDAGRAPTWVGGKGSGGGLWEDLDVAPTYGDATGDLYYQRKDDPILARLHRNWTSKYGEDTLKRIRRRFGIGGPGVWGATDSTEIGTLPIFADPKFNDLSVFDVVVTPEIAREPVDKKTVEWDPITQKDAATFETSEFPVVADQDDTVTPQSLSVKLMYGRVRFSGHAERVRAGFGVDLMTDRVQRRIQAMMELTEATNLEGDGSSGSWVGMTNLFTSNVEDLGGGIITLDNINDGLLGAWNNGGRPDFGIAPHDVVNKIASILEDKGIQRREIIPTTQAVGGWAGRAQEIIYNGIPIRGTRLMDSTPGSMNLVFYQRDMLRMPTLLDISMMDLGVTTDAKDVLLKTYLHGLKDLSANAGAGDGSGGKHHTVIKNIAVV